MRYGNIRQTEQLVYRKSERHIQYSVNWEQLRLIVITPFTRVSLQKAAGHGSNNLYRKGKCHNSTPKRNLMNSVRGSNAHMGVLVCIGYPSGGTEERSMNDQRCELLMSIPTILIWIPYAKDMWGNHRSETIYFSLIRGSPNGCCCCWKFISFLHFSFVYSDNAVLIVHEWIICLLEDRVVVSN